jgi:glycosyltransferase involved in cell wall biosynthesis
MASLLRRPSSCLLVENADDLAYLRSRGVDPGARFAVLGSSGVDTQALQAIPLPSNETPVTAFVGHMCRQTGVDVLMQAYDELGRRGARCRLEFHGDAEDADTREEMGAEAVHMWCAAHKVQWLSRAEVASDVWRRADICALPVRSGEALPNAALEAAACARPLIVTDIPGCRHFVRHGIEGLVVPAENPVALADAIERLAHDPESRQRMGEAARLRLLHGFTEAHVKQSLRAAYASMAERTQAA